MPRTRSRLAVATALDPAALGVACGLVLDGWQAEVIRSPMDALLCASRQVGKSTTAALCVLGVVQREPGALCLLVAKVSKQAKELLRKTLDLHRALGSLAIPITNRTASGLEFANGARVIVIASDDETVRGFSAPRLVVIDEAAWVRDEVLTALRPMLATSGGRLVALSTPGGRRGWFWRTWRAGGATWLRVRVKASECPRISAAFLARERAAMRPQDYLAEYEAEFTDAAGAFFDSADIMAAFDSRITPYRRRRSA